MTKDEWVDAAVLELVNEGRFYKIHSGDEQALDTLDWGIILNFLSVELRALYRRSVHIGSTKYVCRRVRQELLNYYGHLEKEQETNLCCEITLPPKQEETKMNTKVVVKTFVGNVEASTWSYPF